MSVGKPGKPDIASIVENSRAVLSAGFSARETALKALETIEDELRSAFAYADEDLTPLIGLMAELRDLGDPAVHPAPIAKRLEN